MALLPIEEVTTVFSDLGVLLSRLGSFQPY